MSLASFITIIAGGGAPAIPPHFVSAEVGTVNSTTVALTLDANASAAGDDYASGWTVKVGGSAITISSAARQTNHALIYLTVTPAIVYGNTVTVEYNASAGNIVGETGGAALANVSAQAVTNNVAFTPTQIAGLQRWYKADAGAGTNDGDPVSSWVDQTANANATQSNALKKPLYKVNIQNGQPAVRFDDSNDILSFTNLDLGTAATVFIVLKWSAFDGVLLGGASGSYTSYVDATNWYYRPSATTGNVNIAHNFATGVATLTEVYRSGTTVQFLKNGTQVGTDKTLAADIAQTINTIGANADESNILGADMCEILIYNAALSDANRALLRSYLNTRWNLY